MKKTIAFLVIVLLYLGLYTGCSYTTLSASRPAWDVDGYWKALEDSLRAGPSKVWAVFRIDEEKGLMVTNCEWYSNSPDDKPLEVIVENPEFVKTVKWDLENRFNILGKYKKGWWEPNGEHHKPCFQIIEFIYNKPKDIPRR